jgi:hypothetical protein
MAQRSWLPEIVPSIQKLLSTTPADFQTSRNISFLTETFEDPGSEYDDYGEFYNENIRAILQSSTLYDWAASDLSAQDDLKSPFPKPLDSTSQLSAKLHCLHGYPSFFFGRMIEIHPYARSLVYDLRQYTTATLWGPFLPDGAASVDWEKMEAIMIIISHNLDSFVGASIHATFDKSLYDVWRLPFAGAYANSFLSKPSILPMEPPLPLDAQDPYGVTGTWLRFVCFLDYTELWAFNFTQSHDLCQDARPPLDTEEAFRLILMHLRVTNIEEPGEEDGKGMPVVTFEGVSRSMLPSFDTNANAKMRGKFC